MHDRLTLSVSILDPSLTPEQIEAISPKEQLLTIMDHLKSTGMLSHVIKVGLLVTDLSQFKDLNAEYVKYFGIKPPVRVCVEIPSKEVIAFFHVFKDSATQEFAKVQTNMHVQSISKWAPPNIGPYSQANKIDNIAFLAG
mmetsp:Transcript_32778/g.50030  ORF Transcript_32778/g.50030 Transcript_32778/m.50030 type:complete len:140 (+) Transcript_32778:792-1211(+)